jgi:hypothetical protein
MEQDEKYWKQMNEKESQEAALVQHMRNSQQQAEHGKKCTAFVEVIKELRKKYPNDQQYGRVVAKILKAENL